MHQLAMRVKYFCLLIIEAFAWLSRIVASLDSLLRICVQLQTVSCSKIQY